MCVQLNVISYHQQGPDTHRRTDRQRETQTDRQTARDLDNGGLKGLFEVDEFPSDSELDAIKRRADVFHVLDESCDDVVVSSDACQQELSLVGQLCHGEPLLNDDVKYHLQKDCQLANQLINSTQWINNK